MSLIKTLKENKNTRKLFGKKEIEIIEKQLNGIKLMPSEQTRLSRDIRKKFDAIKELAKYSDEFQITRGKILKEKIENAKEIILESKYLSKIRKIVLFGSAVENELNYRSDLDIAVIFSDISKEESDEFRIKATGRLSENIDIQVYNFLPEKIRKEIDEKGKIIWEKT